MKKIFRKIIVFKLKLAAKILLWRKSPEVIAITGSAGKTSAKEFLKKFLEIDFDVLATAEGYNTEIGAPLALFSEKVPKNINSIFGWLLVVIKVIWKALTIRDYPQKVVVEMGADAPGDIKYLCSIFKPQIGVILTVLPVHLAEFKSVQAVAEEKSELAKALPKNGKLLLNFDDPLVKAMAAKTQAKVYFFGTSDGADFEAKNLKSDLTGLGFELHYGDHNEKMAARLYGKQMIYPLLSAVSVSLTELTSVGKIKEVATELKPFKGRMNVLEGIKGSIIIDDSYNANPKSVIEALRFLRTQKGRRIALLGSMNELGDFEQEGHEQVGREAALAADILVTVGTVAEKYLAPAAVSSGLDPKRVGSFKTSTEAGDYLKDVIKEGDIILAKGSQNNVRLEKAVAILMANPEKKRELLTRQSEFWQDV